MKYLLYLLLLCSPIFVEAQDIYSGDPRDPRAWSELAVGATPARTSSISSVYLDKVEAGDPTYIESVYVFHHASEVSFPVNIADLVSGIYFFRFIQAQRAVKLVVQ